MGDIAWNNYDLHRSVNVSSISRETEASWMGYQAGLSSQVGYAATLGSISIRPSIGASYTVLQQQAYTESGGGAGVDLAIDSNTFQSLRANAEVRLSTILSASPQFVPFLRGGISHEVLDAKPEANGHFVSGGPAFSMQGDPLNKDTPYVGIGLSAVGGFSRLSVEYTGMFGDRVTSHQAAATISMAF
jgi:subtilase-type serine protease